jgi:hypothetical protein
MSFEQANDFGNRAEEIYHELGYNNCSKNKYMNELNLLRIV